MEEIYRAIAHFLSYQGIEIHRHEFRELYFRIMERQRKEGGEQYPEFDAVGIFRSIINELGSDYTRSLPQDKLAMMPLFLAELYRGISMHYLRLYPGVKEVLDDLRKRFSLAIVTDAQRAYAVPELYSVGLLEYFNPIIVSSDHGFRKPDKRLFMMALKELAVEPGEALYIGNNLFHDIYGASQAGLKTIFFSTGVCNDRGGHPDYTIKEFPELLKAVSYFESR